MKFLTQRSLHLIFAFAVCASFLNFFLNLQRRFGMDYSTYFEPLSFFVRSAVTHYGVFPLHNPWRCGGSDFLINPQTRVFSPFVLADIFLTPGAASISSMVILGFAGVWGMYKVLKHTGNSDKSSVVGAILFIGGSWFGLHFAVGHVVYAEMQLLPWVFLCGLRYREKKMQFLLLSVFILMLLDGAIQAFIYCPFVLLCAWYVLRKEKKPVEIPALPIDRHYLSKLVAIFILVTGVKTVPVAMSIRGREPTLDVTQMRLELLFQTFLYPWQDFRVPMPAYAHPYMFHEFGCYLGWVALGLVLMLLFTKQAKRYYPYYVITLLWFWIGTGLIRHINPWRLMQKIPIVNHAHLQSRLLIIMFLFFIILVTVALDYFKNKRILWTFLTLLLLGETAFVRNYSTLFLSEGTVPALMRNDFMRSDNLDETVMDGTSIDHYLVKNRGGLACNDRSFYPSSVSYKGHSTYRGEIFYSEGRGTARIKNMYPGHIEVQYQADTEAVISVNNNFLWGWEAKSPTTPVVSKNFSDLVKFKVAPGSGIAQLDYHPKYFYPCLLLFLIGCLFYGLESRSLYKCSRNNNFTFGITSSGHL